MKKQSGEFKRRTVSTIGFDHNENCARSCDSNLAPTLILRLEDPDVWIRPEDSVVVTLNAGEIVASDAFPAGLTLRFPRITRLRLGADRKDPSDIANESSLWGIYLDVVESRSSASNVQPQLQLGSPTKPSSGSLQQLRFLTEEKYETSLRKKKVFKASKRLFGVHVPVTDERCSIALQGVSVAVLGKGFAIVEGSVDFEEAREEGWLDVGRKVKEAKDVIEFIQKHGGTYKISATSDCTFVLGGNQNDPKVVNYIRAVENARSNLTGKPSATKRAKVLETMASCPGVLRWTVIYSLVHRWLSRGDGSRSAIQDKCPQFLRPSVLDFVLRPNMQSAGGVFDSGLLESDLSGVSKMRRALTFISQTAKFGQNIGETKALAWQDTCTSRLVADDRWIAACGHQLLWPFMKNAPANECVVVYPDIFDDLGEAKRSLAQVTGKNRRKIASEELQSGCVAAVLPLLRIMGAFIAYHLHDGVTHVLSDLRDESDEILVDENSQIPSEVFRDSVRGEKIFARFKELENRRLKESKVLLVGPRWVRKHKF
jgi:hypothetical protein